MTGVRVRIRVRVSAHDAVCDPLPAITLVNPKTRRAGSPFITVGVKIRVRVRVTVEVRI